MEGKKSRYWLGKKRPDIVKKLSVFMKELHKKGLGFGFKKNHAPLNNGITNQGKKFPVEKYPNFGTRGIIIPFKDTSIEVKIQNFLSLLHLEFMTHKYISEITHKYRCDIFIPEQEGISQKIIIECDGCYWHGCEFCNKKSLIDIKTR